MKPTKKYLDPFDESMACCIESFQVTIDFAYAHCPKDERDMVGGRCAVCDKFWYKEKSTGKMFRYD